MAKKYYWLKLMNDFFQQPKMKKLRKIAGGDTYTIIYLKMQLLSLKTGGKLYYDGIEETFAEELALTIDEDEDNVLFTLMYLQKQGLIEKIDEQVYTLPEAVQRIGSESDAAERMRRMRENKKEAKALADQGVKAIEAAPEASQCYAEASQCYNGVRTCDTEIEIDIDIEKDKEREEENDAGDKSPATPPAKKKSSRFVPPTLEEIRAYCEERRNGVDAARFFDYYTATNWYRGKTKVKDWRACVRTWEQNEQQAPRYPSRAQNERSRVKSEAEHARGGSSDGFGWA